MFLCATTRPVEGKSEIQPCKIIICLEYNTLVDMDNFEAVLGTNAGPYLPEFKYRDLDHYLKVDSNGSI